MEQFHAILLEGLFYEKDGEVFVEQANGVHTSFAAAMSPVVGRKVLFTLHHVPPHGVVEGEPGLGSCRYPGGAGCPARHDYFPRYLISLQVEGVFRSEPWRVESSQGSVTRLPLEGLVGHYSRVGATTVLDLARMREKMRRVDSGVLAGHGLVLVELQNLLERIRRG